MTLNVHGPQTSCVFSSLMINTHKESEMAFNRFYVAVEIIRQLPPLLCALPQGAGSSRRARGTRHNTGACMSRNLHYFPALTALNALVEDGAVRHHIVQNGSGLSEPDILGKFGAFSLF